jgi:hypothetical protein
MALGDFPFCISATAWTWRIAGQCFKKNILPGEIDIRLENVPP